MFFIFAFAFVICYFVFRIVICFALLGHRTDLYRKPTDRNTLLHGQSYHPTMLKRSLPISQFNRIRRICSSEQSYAQQSTDLISRFRVRGHNEDWIQSAVGRFENENQETSLYKKRSKSENKTTVCAVQ